MGFRLPPQTRVILVPSDERPSREYVVGRNLALVLAGLSVVLALLVIVVLATGGRLVRKAAHNAAVEQELAIARVELARTAELEREIEEIRGLQERLLFMLGVEPAAAVADTAAVAEAAIGTATGAAAGKPDLRTFAPEIMTPPPDLWPSRGYVTKEFTEGDTHRGEMPHLGIDLVAPTGSPLLAAGRGVVVRAEWDDYLGNYVEIRHGFGYVTVYGHCNSLSVLPGDRVDRGQRIGELGGTGQASAPHLHFEVWKGDRAVDPRSVIPGDPQP